MKYKDFPASQYQLIDVTTAMLTMKMYGWADQKLTLNVSKDNKELDRFASMVQIGNYIVGTSPDECGELRFKKGMGVVRRSSGIFSTGFTVVSVDGATARISHNKDKKEHTVFTSMIREDGVAFILSDKLENEINITGTPITGNEILSIFLEATIANGDQSKAWSSLRIMDEVPDQDDVPNSGVSFVKEIQRWWRTNEEGIYKKVSIGDVVIRSLANYIINGDYNKRAAPTVGRVTNVKSTDNGRTYTVTNEEGGNRQMYRWQFDLLATK